MSRTITAMFDTRGDADAGRARLLAANIDADNVRIHDQSMAGASNDAHSTTGDIGMWASIKNAFLPDEDRHTYEEGVRRGGFLLTADVDEDEIDQAVSVLEGANGVDMDERSTSWKNDGWMAPAASSMSSTQPAMFGNERSDEDASIPGNKERFVAGKREVERGSTRVRSYVTDMPAHEQARHRTGADRNDNSSMHNDAGTDVGNTAAGLGKEAMGNIKQGLGSLTGDEDLKRSGEEQERSGEAQRGTTPDRSY